MLRYTVLCVSGRLCRIGREATSPRPEAKAARLPRLYNVCTAVESQEKRTLLLLLLCTRLGEAGADGDGGTRWAQNRLRRSKVDHGTQ